MAKLTDRHVELLWERMAKIYGHRWVSSYGVSDDGTWRDGLGDVSSQQISAGLEACRKSESGWPPTLPEFRALCLGSAHRENAAAYRVTPRIIDKAHLLSSDEREQKRETVRGGIKAMREALSGRSDGPSESAGGAVG